MGGVPSDCAICEDQCNPDILSGWLNKRGEIGLDSYLDKHPTRRYFRQCILSYYRALSTGQELMGSIDLTQDEGDLGIQIKTIHRDYYLEATSAEQKIVWLTALMQCVSANLHHVYSSDAVGSLILEPLKSKFEPYCQDFCPGITIPLLTHFFTLGTLVAKQIVADAILTPSTPGEIVALMWLLMAKVASYNELFTSGVIRIDDTNGKLFNYLNSCEGVYPRVSSHFGERLSETFKLNPGEQRGLDFRIEKDECRLPAGKKSILFFRLGDDTTVIKMELAGCPPFWQEEFQSLDNVKEFAKHMGEFVKTRVSEGTGLTTKRKEHVPVEVRETFYDALQHLCPQFEVDLDQNRETREQYRSMYQQGMTFGISKMIELLESLDQEDDNFPDRHLGVLKSYTRMDKLRLYKGERKGLEVCLPSLLQWHELQKSAS